MEKYKENGRGDFFERVRLKGRPQANPAAVVIEGHARFTVLTERLLRLEWSETGQFEDGATFGFPTRYSETVPLFEVVREAHPKANQLTSPEPKQEPQPATNQAKLSLTTKFLRLSYSGGQFTPESLQIDFLLDGKWQSWRPGMLNRGNLHSTRRTLDGIRGEAALREGFNSREGWAVFDETLEPLFDETGWPVARPGHAVQDWYFFGYGHDYKAAVQDYVKFGGAVPLIPKFVLGTWWSRYWAYSEQDLRELVADFERHELPLDVLVLDMDWHTPNSWTGYSWNKELFPNPPEFLAWLHQRGLRVTLNLHPAEGVQQFEDAYPKFARAMGLDPAQGEPVPFRITDKKFVRHYFEMLHHTLEAQGVDFWWMDWQQGTTTEVKGLDPLPWLNHLHFHDSTRLGNRAMLFSRWGGAGAQRYHIGFSGDTYAEWEALKFLPYMTATAANVAYGWWSHDIGGHIDAVEPELFVRWVQYGALSPCLRLHATKDPLAERRPWAFPEPYFNAAKFALQLRHELIPYLYTMARVAADSAISLCRPMYFEHPTNESAYVARGQYYLGDNLIAAPIVEPADPATGLAAIDVWIPEGRWFTYETTEIYEGPHWERFIGDLYRIPLLVKEGTILPIADRALSVEKTPTDHLTLQVFPLANTGESAEFRLYEDDGTSLAYEQGQFEWTTFRQTRLGSNKLQIEILPVEGHCEKLPESRRYTLTLYGIFGIKNARLGSLDIKNIEDQLPGSGDSIILPALDKREHATIIIEFEQDDFPKNEEPKLRWLPILSEFRKAFEKSTGLEPTLPDVLQLAPSPTRDNFIARLGGPLVHFREYTTPEDTANQFGHAVISAAGLPVKVSWTLHNGAEQQEFVQEFQAGNEPLILATPFRWEGAIRALQWECTVEIPFMEQTLTYRHSSKPLLSSIPDWTLYGFKVGEPDTKVKVSRYTQNPATLEHLDWGFSLTVAKLLRPYFKMQEDVVAQLETRFFNPHERECRIEFKAPQSCPVRFYLNGTPVELDPTQQTRLTRNFPPGSPVRYTLPVTLPAGENQLVMESEGQPENWRWTVSAAIIRANGEMLADLQFEG